MEESLKNTSETAPSSFPGSQSEPDNQSPALTNTSASPTSNVEPAPTDQPATLVGEGQVSTPELQPETTYQPTPLTDEAPVYHPETTYQSSHPADEEVFESDMEPATLNDEPPPIEGSVSTSINYSLRFTGWPSISQLVAVAAATALYTILSYYSIGALPSVASYVSPIFIAIGFGIPFALWFGEWAFVIAYIGNFVGAGLLVGTPLPIAALFGTTDFIQLCIPMILYRLFAKRFGVSAIGKDVFTLRGFLFFLVCAVIPNNIIGGLYGTSILRAAGFVPGNLQPIAWALWSSSNIVIILVISSILMATLGPIVERFGLTIRDGLR